MDLAFTIIAGLSLRVGLLRSEHPLAKFSPALVGGWEGVVVHQLSSRSENEMDHLLAFGLRLLIDHFVSGDPSRTVMTVIWTAIGFAASEALTPRSSLQPFYSSSYYYSRRDRDRRRPRASRSLSTQITASRRRSVTPDSSARLTTPTPIVPKLPQIRASNRVAKVPVHRPPSPPSTFLQSSELEPASPIIAAIDPLELSPIRPADGITAYPARPISSTSSSSTDPLLPTPPKSVPSENVANTRDSESPNRLSTIPEITTVDEKTPSRRQTSVRTASVAASPARKVDETQETVIPLASPSQKGNEIATPGSPLPVPNLTMRGFSMSNRIPDNEETATPAQSSLAEQAAIPQPTPTSSAPTPIWDLDEPLQGGELLSPLSGGPEFGARHARNPQSTSDIALLSPLSGGPEFGSRHTRGQVHRAPTDATDEPLSPVVSGLGITIRPPAPEVRRSQRPPPPTQDELLSPMDTGSDLSPPPPPRGSRAAAKAQHRPPPPTDDLLSPMSDINDLDELRTPPVELRGSGGEISDDPLRTPFQSPDALSPLLFDSRPVPARSTQSETRTFGQPSGFQAFAAIDSGTDAEYLDAPGSIPGSMPSPPVALPAAATQANPVVDPQVLLSPAESVLSSHSPTKLTVRAEKLRQDARQTEKDLQQSRQDYNQAMREKRFSDGLIIKGRIADLEEQVKKLHKSAARRYFVSLNDFNPKKEHTIDVHGLRPSEALERTEKALRETLTAGHSTLRVIVGKGLHSANGQPVLKGHITAAMERQKVACQVDPRNAGVLILTLPPPN